MSLLPKLLDLSNLFSKKKRKMYYQEWIKLAITFNNKNHKLLKLSMIIFKIYRKNKRKNILDEIMLKFLFILLGFNFKK